MNKALIRPQTPLTVLQRISFLLILLLFAGLSSAKAQKFGYLDSEYILSKMPDYQTVKSEMNKWTERWAKEVSDKYAELEKMERAFRNEEVLLTDAMKQERQRSISEKDKELREFNNKVFGLDGLLFQKKTELMKPLMDQIDKAVQKVARQKQLMFIFDKSSEGATLIYTDPRHDYTDYVMEELGLSTDTNKTRETESVKTAAATDAKTPATNTKKQPKN